MCKTTINGKWGDMMQFKVMHGTSVNKSDIDNMRDTSSVYSKFMWGRR